jgi:hypothetical protein
MLYEPSTRDNTSGWRWGRLVGSSKKNSRQWLETRNNVSERETHASDIVVARALIKTVALMMPC